MKTKILLAILFLSSTLVFSQTKKEYNDFLVSGLKLTTKEIVYKELKLTPEQVNSFDAVFDTYLTKRSAIAQDRLPLLNHYALNAETMSHEELKKFNAYIIHTNGQLRRLNKKYYNKARKVIPIQKATKLFLIENYLRNAVENEVVENLIEFL